MGLCNHHHQQFVNHPHAEPYVAGTFVRTTVTGSARIAAKRQKKNELQDDNS